MLPTNSSRSSLLWDLFAAIASQNRHKGESRLADDTIVTDTLHRYSYCVVNLYVSSVVFSSSDRNDDIAYRRTVLQQYCAHCSLSEMDSEQCLFIDSSKGPIYRRIA